MSFQLIAILHFESRAILLLMRCAAISLIATSSVGHSLLQQIENGMFVAIRGVVGNDPMSIAIALPYAIYFLWYQVFLLQYAVNLQTFATTERGFLYNLARNAKARAL